MKDTIKKYRDREDGNIKTNLGDVRFRIASFTILALEGVQVVGFYEHGDRQGISLSAEKQSTLKGRSVHHGVLGCYLFDFLFILCCIY
jgi:hypothetical protein